MKTTFFYAAMLLLFALTFAACNSDGAKNNQENSAKDTAAHSTTAAVYSCSMHPEEKSDKPGQCPKCGMDMEKTETSSKQGKMDNMSKEDMRKMNMDTSHAGHTH
ncbi:MAG TPA: heavy metal-binding domain-containing protein [Sphingobacteriaceae bacterium]|nr:heavy metal-binding domain-containing protein [Sphingobacteriaceae bacterium]